MSQATEMNNSDLPYRILHTMLRVSDLERSINFYRDMLGMTIFSRENYTDGRFTLVFLGYGDSTNIPAIELTYNWDVSTYQHGTRYGHIALEVFDLYKLCDFLHQQGIAVLRAPGHMRFVADETEQSDVIAFIEDPDGYKIELIQA